MFLTVVNYTSLFKTYANHFGLCSYIPIEEVLIEKVLL